MYSIEIYDLDTNRSWIEKFDSYYYFKKRVMKLNHSLRLVIISRSLLDSER